MKIVLMSISTWPALACSVALLAACGSAATGTTAPGGSGEPNSGGHRLRLVTSFYPLQFATARIAGSLADVSSLTKPGGEPHDLELAPRDVARIADADLVVYLSGFQPAVDDAVRSEARRTSLDVAPAARLDLTGVAEESGRAGRTAVDPHFWLDPTRLSAVADLIADRLSRLDPAGASTFQANAQALGADLAALDAEFSTGLASCTNRDVVTSHQAFGYLAQRYHLTQVGITGPAPEQEPDPATLARVADFVRDNGVRTIYYETLLSPAIARTVAAETGARTAVLDPIEGITRASPGRDYLDVMRADLAALKAGQPCP
jgi:zinc transport system substrate-binding protein